MTTDGRVPAEPSDGSVPALALEVVDRIGLASASIDPDKLSFDDAARAALGESRVGIDPSAVVEVSLLLTGDEGIAELHGEFLDDPTETDVMSFETDVTSFDLVVNVERAVREARARSVEAESELLLYVVHGMLHCVGYDDHDPEDRREMRAAEERVLQRLGHASAPVDESSH